MTSPGELRVTYSLVFRKERPWLISDCADTLEESEQNIREHYGHDHNPPLKFRRHYAEDRDGKRVAGRGEWMR